VGIR